jgi:hypothetical protein
VACPHRFDGPSGGDKTTAVLPGMILAMQAMKEETAVHGKDAT